MINKDRQLGMHQPITRRDFVNGIGMALTGSMFAGSSTSAFGAAPPLDPYPPRRTGRCGDTRGTSRRDRSSGSARDARFELRVTTTYDG